ncbi:MAG: lamin tail domain-containing protein, partial [Flavobacteriia bacterium]
MNISTVFSQVVINEIMVKPGPDATSSLYQSLKMCSSSTSGTEYIELYNADPCNSIDISCYLIGFNVFTSQSHGTFRFPAGSVIPPLGFLSIGGPNSGATINLFNYCSTPNLNTGNDRWYLENGDGYIILYDPTGNVVDAVYWTFSAGQANKWGTDSDISNPPTLIAAGVGCPIVTSLPGPSSIPISNASYAGQGPNTGTVLERTTDGGVTWATNASPTINNCNGTCVTSSGCGTVCDPTGNLVIYSNYDGGILTINVDQNIPNLKVGICTYEPIQVTFTGPFVGNITQVIYAGMNSNQNNNNCGLGNFTTSITGVPAGIVTISPPMNPPLVGYTPAHGNGAGPWGGQLIGVAGLCDTTVNAGGGNTPDEVVYYFLNATSGTLLFHQTQYACWVNETINVTTGGNCCILPPVSNPCPTITSTISGQTNVLCNGQSTGAATVTANGGTGPYTYTWTPGNLNGATQTGLAANVYSVNIVDANLCPGSTTVTITQPAALTAPTATVSSQPTCSVSTGTITVSSPAPAAGITYTVTGTAPVVVPQTNSTGIFSGLTSGTYSVMATVNGCSSPLTNLIVNTPPGLPATPTASVTTLATCTAPTGTITVTVPTPAAGTTYTVTGTVPVVAAQSNSTGVFNNLTVGTYDVTTTVNGCTSTASVVVISAPIGAPIISLSSSTDVSCNGGNDGAAIVNGSGGTGALTYSWSPGSLPGSTQSTLTAGIYTVTVTDASGCSNTLNVTIGEPSLLSITETIVPANCGSADGSISIVVSGGTGTYTTSWTPGGSTATSITGLTPGNYSVTVTDQQGCSSTENYVVPQT